MGNAVERRRPKDAEKTKKSKVKRSTSAYEVPEELAAMQVTIQQIQKVKEAFATYDKSKTGKISTKYFIYVMRSLGQNPTEEDTHEMIREADPNGTNTIDFVRFLEIWAKYSTNDQHAAIKEALHLFDESGSGMISLKDFRWVMKNGDSRMTDQEINDIVSQVDVDGHGLIDINEFLPHS